MLNSIAAGRRLALRVVLAQAGVTLLVAAGFLAQGWHSCLGVLVGGGAVVLGTAVLALRMFATGPTGAGATLAKLIAGNLLKWIVIGAGLYLALAKADLPGLPVLAGVLVTTFVAPFAVAREN
jgi:F0F1-type ATP synthase assembly protein I